MHTMDPVDEVEIWAPILADPLDWPSSSGTIPLPSQVEEYFNYVYNNYAMEIDHFIEEPQDAACEDQYLGEFIPKEKLRCNSRVSCKRRISPPNPPYVPSGSQVGRWQCRKNNERWKQAEVIKLVEGVETYGVGRWTKVKKHYFPEPSVRDSTHLKDKWRNLLRACGVPCYSKMKEKKQKRMFRPLGTRLIKRIQRLAIS